MLFLEGEGFAGFTDFSLDKGAAVVKVGRHAERFPEVWA